MGNFRALAIAIPVVLATGVLPAPSPAQSYPNKPIRIVSPGVAGSPGDVRARQVAQKLSDKFAQPVIVDNRPGANGAIAAKQAAKAAPDGYTLLSCNVNQALNDLLNPDPGARLNRELVAITSLTSGPLILAVHPAVAAASMKEFIDLAKAKPGTLSHSTSGQGSLSHLLAEWIKSRSGINIRGIPYKSTTAEIPDVLGGHINATFNYFQIIGPHIASGKLRPLGVAAATRLPVAPDLVTMSEAGLPGVEATGWNGICAPAGTPRSALNLLYREIVDALNDSTIRGQMISTGAIVGGERPEQFAAFIRDELMKWGKVIKDAGISLQ